jgi:hypothetical protein
VSPRVEYAPLAVAVDLDARRARLEAGYSWTEPEPAPVRGKRRIARGTALDDRQLDLYGEAR